MPKPMTVKLLYGLLLHVDNRKMIKILLNAGSNSNIEDCDGYTSLHAAVGGNCSKSILRTMIHHGANVNCANKQNITALMIASKKGNVDAMNALLRAGADQTIGDADGRSWIHHAVHRDCSKKVLQSIIELGADVNAVNKQNVTALMIATNVGNLDAMDVLIRAGADRTIEDAKGNSWIHYAVLGDCSKEVLQTIINLGADVNATNKFNWTALMLASIKGNVDAMNVLIRAGADRTIKDAKGDSWIHYAVLGDCSKEVLQSIINLGADVNATNKCNKTALMIATNVGNVDAMDVLIRAGADRTIKDAKGGLMDPLCCSWRL